MVFSKKSQTGLTQNVSVIPPVLGSEDWGIIFKQSHTEHAACLPSLFSMWFLL